MNVRALRLMPRSTSVVGITGGEPTLLGARLVELLSVCRSELPSAQIDVLTNGRRFIDRNFARKVGEVADDKVLFTIPLYADNPVRHDYIVQSRGAFEETVSGIYALAEVRARSEIRVVLHRESVGRLLHLARFIQKNIPFVDQVVFMGLEMTGLARSNNHLLWIEPLDYMDQLEMAIEYLTDFGIATSIYNLPRCLTSRRLWPFLRKSISDWKREFLPECEACSERVECGGVFGTSTRLSAHIRAL